MDTTAGVRTMHLLHEHGMFYYYFFWLINVVLRVWNTLFFFVKIGMNYPPPSPPGNN